MRLAQSKEKYSNVQTTAAPSLSTTLHSSKSFIFKESQANNQGIIESQKAKHNFKPSSGKALSSSRSVNKIEVNSQYSSTQRDSLGIPTEMKKQCENCERLKSKGLSTDFCLQHFDSTQ